MNTQHPQSPCCGVPSIKYGFRRWQCTRCRKTWRGRKKKRGRKRKRVSPKLAFALFETKSTVKQRARNRQLTERQYQYRMIKSLRLTDGNNLYSDVPPQSKLLLLVDGIWAHCNRKRAVVYLLAVRPIETSEAFILPPRIISGVETNRKWRSIIDDLPSYLKRQIVALVCDGLTGLTEQAEKRGWIVQRCQFHFIKTIERFRGKKNRFVKDKMFREDLYQTMRRILALPEGRKVDALFAKLKRAGENDRCPSWVKILTRELLCYRNEFRAYLLHPELRLPATNGCMESLAAVVRHRLYLSRGFKTIEGLSRWMSGLIYSKKHMRCNGTDQPIYCR